MFGAGILPPTLGQGKSDEIKQSPPPSPSTQQTLSEFDPKNAISFEFVWQGVSAYYDNSEVIAIDIQFDQATKYEVFIPATQSDPNTSFLINFNKKDARAKGFLNQPSDYIQVAGKPYAHQMSMNARIAKPNPKAAKKLFKLTFKPAVPHAAFLERSEKLNFDLSGLKPGHHYKIAVTHVNPIVALKVELIEDGLFRPLKKRPPVEYKGTTTPLQTPKLPKPPQPSSSTLSRSRINALILALNNTEVNRFDAKFKEIINLGTQLLENLQVTTLPEKIKDKQANLIFLGTLISAYSFHRWKQFGETDDESLYFWLVVAGMARIITGDNARTNKKSPYRDLNNAVYQVKNNKLIFTRLILAIGNQFMNAVQAFNAEIYGKVFPRLLPQISQIVAAIPLNAPEDFFERQEQQILELMTPHQDKKISSSLTTFTSPMEEKLAPTPMVITPIETTFLHDKLVTLIETPLETAILQLRTLLLSDAAKKISIFSEAQMLSIKTPPTVEEKAMHIRKACWNLIDKLSPEEFLELYQVIREQNADAAKTALQKMNGSVKLNELAQEVLANSTPAASTKQIQDIADKFTQFVTTCEGEMIELGAYLNANEQFKKMSSTK